MARFKLRGSVRVGKMPSRNIQPTHTQTHTRTRTHQQTHTHNSNTHKNHQSKPPRKQTSSDAFNVAYHLFHVLACTRIKLPCISCDFFFSKGFCKRCWNSTVTLAYLQYEKNSELQMKIDCFCFTLTVPLKAGTNRVETAKQDLWVLRKREPPPTKP